MSDLKFTELWFDQTTQRAVSNAYESVRKLEGSIVEIGSWEGLSSVFIANLVHPEELICIDTWEGTPYEPYEINEYGVRDIESTFRHNIKFGTKQNVNINKMTWQEYFKVNSDMKIKLLYLDGPHGYDDVCEQIEFMQPLIVEGGVIVGDDYHYFDSVKRAVNDTLGTTNNQSPFDIDTWVWTKEGN